MEDNWQKEKELLESEPRTGLTLDFRAPLTVNEETIELYFYDITNSYVQCEKRGDVVRVTFIDTEAFQRVANISSYTIEDGCVLILMPTATTMPPLMASVANPTNSHSASPTEPQSGVDFSTNATTLVLSVNVDCQEHITKYCLEELNHYLNVPWCVVRSTVVPGVLLLEYSTSASQLDVGHIVNEIYEYTHQFTTLVVAVSEHRDEQNLKRLMQPCCSSVSYNLMGCFSESKLYKICCKVSYAPKLHQSLSGATKVPLASCKPSADASGKADLKRREEDPHSDAACAVKSEPSASDTVANSATALASSDVLALSVAVLNSDASHSLTASSEVAPSAVAAAQIASPTGSVVSESVSFIAAPDSSTSAGFSVAFQQDPQKSLVSSSPTIASTNAAVSTAARNFQQAAALAEHEASVESQIQKTPEPIESAKSSTLQRNRFNVAADDVPLTVPADDWYVQLFKKDLEWRFRKDLEELFPITEPTCGVKYTYNDAGFHFFGSRDSVLKAKALLYRLFESVSVDHRQLEINRPAGSTSSQRMGEAGGEAVHLRRKLNDVPATEGMAADRRRNDFGATPEIYKTKDQTLKERSKNELPGKTSDEAQLLTAATLQQDTPDNHSRRDKLAVSAERGATSDHLLLQLEMGSVAEQEADVLVNSVDCALILSNGRISSSFLAKGGQQLQLELKRKHPKGLKEFQYTVTESYGLPCSIVLHVVCGHYRASGSEQNFMSLIFECLSYANKHGMKSIVFPAIGAGALEYPPAVVVKLLHSAVSMFSDAFPKRSLQSVKCVVYDKRTYDSFKCALDTLLRGGPGENPTQAIRDTSLKTAGRDPYAATRGLSTGSMNTSSYQYASLPMSPRAPLQGASTAPWQPSVHTRVPQVYQAPNQTWEAKATSTQLYPLSTGSFTAPQAASYVAGATLQYPLSTSSFTAHQAAPYVAGTTLRYPLSTSSFTAYQAAPYVAGVGSESRFVTPRIVETSNYGSTSLSSSHAASARLTSQPRTRSSGSSKSISDRLFKK